MILWSVELDICRKPNGLGGKGPILAENGCGFTRYAGGKVLFYIFNERSKPFAWVKKKLMEIIPKVSADNLKA